MRMTTELVASEMIPHAAWILGVRSEYLFLKSYQTVDQLENGSRRIRCLDPFSSWSTV